MQVIRIQNKVSLAISRNPKPDSYGWHFTDHSRYTVKSGYRTDKLFLNMGSQDIESWDQILNHFWLILGSFIVYQS